MNQCINRAPRITNPDNVPGLCKHILAARDYIYGMLAKFPGHEPDTGEKLAQLVKTMPKVISTVPVLADNPTLSLEGEAGPEFAEPAPDESTETGEDAGAAKKDEEA